MDKLRQTDIHSCAQLIEVVQQIGFLPLLRSGIPGFSAEEMVADDCHYQLLPDGGWDWPLWNWKGPAVNEGNSVYGKFFNGKAGFVSRAWWPDLCNHRRATRPTLQEGSIEEAILAVLSEHGSLITRELRAACGFTGPKMRSRFDAYVTHLQMGCRIVTEDFVYPIDRHGHQYGWGWSLLTTPEQLYGREACHPDDCAPQESFQRMLSHLCQLLPHASEQQIRRMIG